MDFALGVIQDRFGSEDLRMPVIPFRWTNYYQDELGDSPLRCLISLETTISRESMPDIKLWSNAQELANAVNGKRIMNLDPGYMTLGQFFLATTKDQRQRVYVRDGIYIEPTLYFEGSQWKPFAWTYRDWQSEEYIQFLQVARQRFAYQCTTGRPWSLRASKAKS